MDKDKTVIAWDCCMEQDKDGLMCENCPMFEEVCDHPFARMVTVPLILAEEVQSILHEYLQQ